MVKESALYSLKFLVSSLFHILSSFHILIAWCFILFYSVE